MSDRLTQGDLDAMRAFYGPWTESVLTQDFEAMAEMYTEDAIVMPPNRPAVNGRQELLDFLRSFPRVTKASFEADEIDGYGDMAYVVGRYSMTLEPEGAPGPVEDRGKYIEVRRKQADGRWLLARDIFNSDLQPPGA